MSKKFSELRQGMSLQALKEVDLQVEEFLVEMCLKDIRKARGLSQKTIADYLQINQPAIAKAELREDMFISTLRNYITAMGGELEIVARFPDAVVKISNFSK